jgi:predicted nucleic acid-binding protein
MTSVEIFLVDTSARVIAARYSPAAKVLAALADAGQVACCDPLALELLYSARNTQEFASIKRALDGLPKLEMSDMITARAVEVMAMLVPRGWHRQGVVDLLAAATAEAHHAAVLHYDSDYDRIAEVTGQAARWIVPRGAV